MEGSSPFIKQLASSGKRHTCDAQHPNTLDRKIRDQALDTLRSFMQHRTSVDQAELLKLWKGLFYCMWMSDKPRTQQQLARDLANLVDIVPKEAVVPFLQAFWRTMAREWMGIDVLRYVLCFVASDSN
jgi:ribosomal RNA-processing protein 1